MKVKDVTTTLENRYCIYSRLSLYVMFENVEIDWEWTMQEVKRFDRSLRAGQNIIEIAEKFNRTHEEVMLMAIDRMEHANERHRQEKEVEIYTMLENVEINWTWDMKEVAIFDSYHKMGLSYQLIADKLGRTEAEIIIMTFDRALQDRIGG